MSEETTDERTAEHRLIKGIEWLDGKNLQAGIFGGTNKQKSKKNPKANRPKKGTPIALYGSVMEHGNKAGTITARSFLGDTIDQNQDKYDRQFEKIAGDVIMGKNTFKGGLESMGKLMIRPDIQEMITTKGVIDTGALRMAIAVKISTRILD